jgi:REP element-mobilizing transposase RayT
MSHSLVKIWIHGVFSTKDRLPLIIDSGKHKLYDHITKHLVDDLDCTVRRINGTADHVHLLFQMTPNIAVKDIFQNIKGESSHWWNQQNFSEKKFAWQIGYGAFSVSESQVGQVEEYIKNQEEHHRKMTFQQEIELFIKKNNLRMENR